MTVSQNEVIAFLSDGAAYGLPDAAVERVETHCSVIFLVADRAYKLKRPIAFSSLDYSTIDRREAACRAELDLNRRTAPEIYLGMHAICRKPDGELVLDGAGAAVDWVVEMRRFDQSDLFDHLAEARRLTSERIGSLAAEVAQFHAAAERVTGFGGAEGLRLAIERNRCDQLTVEAILGRAAVEGLHKASREALDRLAPLLDRRCKEGRVRRCHGDLRLANICLIDDRTTLFDGIEFSDSVSCVDVLFDLAFLLMDLHHRGLDVFANLLFNRYLDLTGDSDGLAALPLMLSVRAATRAYAMAGAAQRRALESEAQHHAAAARTHLAQALSLLARSQPRLVAVGGIDGGTKSSLANGLAAGFPPAPGARVLSGEVARRRLLDLPPSMRLSAAAYDTDTSARVYARLAAEAARTVEAGFTAIIDASFAHHPERRRIAAEAAAHSVPFVGLWLGSPRDLRADQAAEAGAWHAIRPGPGPETTVATARLLAHARQIGCGPVPGPRAAAALERNATNHECAGTIAHAPKADFDLHR